MKRRRSLAVLVLCQDAENTRIFLRAQQVLRSDLKIERDETYVYLPILKNKDSLSEYDVIEHWFTTRAKQLGAYEDILNLPQELMELLPTSYDIVGDIILIKLPKKLFPYKKDIGSALLKVHSHCRTVCMVDPVAGELRVRSVEVIAGESDTVTMHREYGMWLKVDVARVYFSARLATERKRIADMVCDKELVVDLFAGVAPFSIMIAKNSSPSQVIAIDKNRDAVRLAKFNIRRNDVADVVKVVQGDAQDAVKLLAGLRANRIIMNLPFGSFSFFPEALAIAKNQCVIHLYTILAEEEVSAKIEELRKEARKLGYQVKSVDVRRIKSYAPYEFYMGFDIVAQKRADVA